MTEKNSAPIISTKTYIYSLVCCQVDIIRNRSPHDEEYVD